MVLRFVMLRGMTKKLHEFSKNVNDNYNSKQFEQNDEQPSDRIIIKILVTNKLKDVHTVSNTN